VIGPSFLTGLEGVADALAARIDGREFMHIDLRQLAGVTIADDPPLVLDWSGADHDHASLSRLHLGACLGCHLFAPFQKLKPL
jgi:hypothetical protein